MKNNFIQRAITGVLFVLILIGCILFHPLSFGVLFTLISALCIHEFAQLINRSGIASINPTVTALGGAYLFLAMMGYCTAVSDARIFLPYLLLLLYLMITELYLKKSNPLGNWAFTMLSQLYIGLPFALLNILAYHNNPAESSISYNPILPLSIFAFLWLNDTGAYCIGSLLGKHRLFERISPKKTWEGFAGGFTFSLISGLAAGYLLGGNLWIWGGMAVVASVTGVMGDFTESMFKRSVGVKDSGAMMPGHGGWLDRFDSMLMSAPYVFVYLLITCN